MLKPTPCLDCKCHGIRALKGFFGKIKEKHACNSLMMNDLVTGENYWDYCEKVREDEARCGYGARWFEEK